MLIRSKAKGWAALLNCARQGTGCEHSASLIERREWNTWTHCAASRFHRWRSGRGIAGLRMARNDQCHRARRSSQPRLLQEQPGASFILHFFFGLIRHHSVEGPAKGRAVSGRVTGARFATKLTSALSNQAFQYLVDRRVNASLLLQNYGGFLPRQGHELRRADQRETSAQMERHGGTWLPAGDRFGRKSNITAAKP